MERPLAVVLTAIEKSLARPTIGIIIDQGEIAPGVGTGVLIRIGDRQFIATVSHNLDNLDKLSFLSSALLKKDATKMPIVRSGRNKRLDVGYIEVPPDREFAGRTAIGLDRIATAGTLLHEGCYLFGYPVELRTLDREPKVVGHDPALMFTMPLKGDDLPEVPWDSRRANEMEDLFMRYDRRETCFDIAPQCRENLPHPGGMSGGGVWLAFKPEGAIWSAEDMKLVAIQSHWLKDCYARSTLIGHWLELIHDDYPDLSATIVEHIRGTAASA